MKKRASRILTFSARETGSYQKSRFRIVSQVVENFGPPEDFLTDHLRRKFLRIHNKWQVLDFTDRDWPTLERVDVESNALEGILMRLVLDYIAVNIDHVKKIKAILDNISDSRLVDDEDKILIYVSKFDDLDRQSLAYLRLQGAIYYRSHEPLVKLLQKRSNSRWVRNGLLYPFVYNAVNRTPDDYMDTFLSFIVPHDAHQAAERNLIRHVLRDDISYSRSLAYKAYVALMCHPYDAYDFLINHFEIEISKLQYISVNTSGYITEMRALLPDMRLDRLHDYFCSGSKPNIIDSISDRLATCINSNVVSQVAPTIAAMLQHDSVCADAGSPPSEIWEHLCRIRWSRYPKQEDFDQAVGFYFVWRFLNCGRIIRSLLHSMYMLPRQQTLFEVREILRLIVYTGSVSSYLLASPRGDALIPSLVTHPSRIQEYEDQVSKATATRQNADDRTWFHATHWLLKQARDAAKIRQWLSIVRSRFPIAPAYLTGIEWEWIDEVLPSVRITPFRSTPDGPYVLLLRDIEEQRRDSTILRTAIEPYAAQCDSNTFLKWLISEYDRNAAAFVKYFFTPENIMLLGFAPNMTAALSDRIHCLEACVAEYRFNELLTEEQVRHEQQTLTSALMLLNVNSNQFDIPWATFKRDVSDRQQDSFNAYVAMNSGDKTLAVLADHRILFPNRFSNGKVVKYSLRSITGPLVIVILGVIDGFLEHPSYGIEAILSTRFRHDTVRREFVSALKIVSDSYIPGVVGNDQRHIVEHQSEIFLNHLDRWLIERIQTVRPGYDNAVFDLVPTQEELSKIIEAVESSIIFDDITVHVIEWLNKKLEAQLSTARKLFIDEFMRDACQMVTRSADTLSVMSAIDTGIVARVTSAVVTALNRRAEELVEWFKTPDVCSTQALSIKQITSAVEGRFESYIASGRLKISLYNGRYADRMVSPDKVKFYFDMVSEIVHNTMKHGGRPIARIKIQPYNDSETWGFLYSSPAKIGSTWKNSVEGHQYLSLSDSLFREGNSGLKKVAAISASIVGGAVRVGTARRRRSFHVCVPLGLAGGGENV